LEETEDRDNLPRSQLAVLTSSVIARYLNEKTAKGTDARKTPEWRLWDDDFTEDVLRDTPKIWKDAYADAKLRSQGKRPWVHVTDGVRGESRELPQTIEEALKLFEKYGGK
jgi:hypothetical protein